MREEDRGIRLASTPIPPASSLVCGGIMRKKGRVHLKIPESSRRRAAHGDPSMPRNAGF